MHKYKSMAYIAILMLMFLGGLSVPVLIFMWGEGVTYAPILCTYIFAGVGFLVAIPDKDVSAIQLLESFAWGGSWFLFPFYLFWKMVTKAYQEDFQKRVSSHLGEAGQGDLSEVQGQKTLT